ncbi:MAG: hypothetical protein AAFY88_03265 [Acidobacteriota bacterium]
MPYDPPQRHDPDAPPRIKGIAMLEVVKGLRLHREAAHRELPTSLHHYLDARIDIGQWYPEEDHIGLLGAVATLFGPPGLDAWRCMGRWRATLDLQEVFVDVLRQGDPAKTLKACEKVWPMYRNTGRVVTTLGDAPPHRLALIDYPYTREQMVRLFTGYLEAALELSGLPSFTVDEPADWTPDRAEWTIHWPAAGTLGDPQHPN